MAAAITFEQAIAQTQALLDRVDQQSSDDGEWGQVVAELVATQDGARGFFVTYLTDPRAIASEPSPALLRALQSSPEIVAELLVKNLAMSTAMTVYHKRQQDAEGLAGSVQVRDRSSRLIALLGLPLLQTRLNAMLESLRTGEGKYKDFLDRWGYDREQRQEMAEILSQVIV